MTSQQHIVDFICEQMDNAGQISARKMFGEYGVYCDGKFIGVICDDALFLKVTQAGQDFAPNLALKPAYKGAKPSFYIPQDKIEDNDWLNAFVKLTHDNLPSKKK